MTFTGTAIWSSFRPFWVDELLELYTDIRPSGRLILAGQLHAPFSLEPPAFHLLLHWCHLLIPNEKLASRLPSLLALLVVEACTFLITWKASRRRVTALVAMLLPFTLVTLDYAPEARVYGLLTACLAVGILCWQKAASSTSHRTLALVGLSLALALLNLLHYFGIFLTLPVFSAEAVRSLQRRRLDPGMLVALCCGTVVVALNLPFAHALAPFRLHYYSTGETNWSNVAFTYHWYVSGIALYLEPRWQRSFENAEYLLVVAVLLACSLRRIVQHWHTSAVRVGLEAALCIAALLPLINVTAAQFTRAYVPRYSLPGVVGVAVLLALALNDLWLTTAGQAVLAVVLVCAGITHLRIEIGKSHLDRTSIVKAADFSPAQRTSIAASADPHIYMQDVSQFLVRRFYAPPRIRQTMVGLYSAPCERFWRNRDPGSLFAHNMQQSANLPFKSFTDLTQNSTPHFLVVSHDPKEEWIELELAAEHASVEPLGQALGGDLLKVTFSQHPTCER